MGLLRKSLKENGQACDLISIYDTKRWSCQFTFTAELGDIADIKYVRN